MSYQVFARKYRPRTFDDLLGQDHVVRTLSNAIEQDRIAQAYLFSGPRGTGKTTTARLIAKALNCPDGPRIDFNPDDQICEEIAEGRSLDVLEIDGASHTGVDNIRDLNKSVQFAPTTGKYRIVYIDEVHMLSTGAFNALLKTLEEPPPHVKFIFATTEPHKVLPTIISRCQRFDLRPITVPIIAKHLQTVCAEESIQLDENAAIAIAKGADGGMRDALSMLDQLVAFCGTHITEEKVMQIFGFTSRETVTKLCSAIFDKDSATALQMIQVESDQGKDLGQIINEVINALRELLVAKIDPNNPMESLTDQARQDLLPRINKLPSERLLKLIDILAETDRDMRNSSNKRLNVEIGILKSIHSLSEARISDVIKVLGGARDQLADATPASQTTAPPAQTPAQPAAAEPEPSQEPKSTPEQPEPANPAPATAPATQAPPPEPEPATEPEPQKQELTESLWKEVEAVIAEQRPLVLSFLGGSKFMRVDGLNFYIALPDTEQFARESLLRPATREFIENLVRSRTGQPHQFNVELSPDLVAPAVEFPEPELIPAPEKKKPAVEPAKEEGKEEQKDDDFYQDPLIKEALALFEAEIKKD